MIDEQLFQIRKVLTVVRIMVREIGGERDREKKKIWIYMVG